MYRRKVRISHQQLSPQRSGERETDLCLLLRQGIGIADWFTHSLCPLLDLHGKRQCNIVGLGYSLIYVHVSRRHRLSRPVRTLALFDLYGRR